MLPSRRVDPRATKTRQGALRKGLWHLHCGKGEDGYELNVSEDVIRNLKSRMNKELMEAPKSYKLDRT